MTATAQTLDSILIWWDTQDQQNTGWAVNVVVDGEHHSWGIGPDLPEDADLDDLLPLVRAEWERRPGVLAQIPDADSGKWHDAAHDGPGWKYVR